MAAIGAPTGPPGGENRDPNTSRIPPVPGPSRGGRGGGRGRGRTSGDGQESSRGRGGSSRGGGGSRRPFYPRFWASRRNDPPREKPVTIAIPSGVGGESPQIETAPVNRRRTMANFAVTQSEKKYPDWKLYLPREAHMEGSPSAVKVAAFEDHIEKCSTHLYDLRQIHRKLHFDVSLDALKEDENFKRAWGDFRNDLMNEPEQTLAYVGIAMHHRLLHFLRGQEIGCLQTISPRIVGFGPAMQLRSLKMTSCDKMICFIGTVARLGPSDIICTWMAFKCPECQTPQTVRQPDGVLTYPKSCKGSACTARSGFEPLIGSPFTRTSSIQTILVEESIEDKNRDIFRKPRSIEVTLTNDLVNSVYPGGDVRVTGVLKLRTDDRKSDKPQNCTYYIHAVNVVSTSNPVVKKTTEFTEKSLRAIELIKTDAFPLRLLVHSLCPAVRGHEMIKFGFLLGLFSANMSTNRDHRQELHVLIVGDPGLGKSCLLKACCSVAPRAIFTSCSGSSVTGLTATVKAEKEDGSCSIEAGALVLADQGVCCIDEFDKMAVNHASMLEVMEQQSVSVAKAGAICTLPARTVILAAGNPANGHYDRSKTVCENIKLHPAILSRFDISFVILDEQRKDNWLRSQSNDSPTTPLYKRLELRPGEDLDALPHALFEKYIAWNCVVFRIARTTFRSRCVSSRD